MAASSCSAWRWCGSVAGSAIRASERWDQIGKKGNVAEESPRVVLNSGRGAQHGICRNIFIFVPAIWMEDLPNPEHSSFAVQSTWYSDRQGRLESSLKFRRVEGRGGALDQNGGMVEVADRWEFNSGESVSPSEDCATRWEERAN